MERGQKLGDTNGYAGQLTITRIRRGYGPRKHRVIEQLGPFPNKVVSSSGHGRNLVMRKLCGDNTYGIEVDSCALGDSSTAAADAQTDLLSPLVTGLELTSKTPSNNQATFEIFVPDGDLPDDTYAEFGLFVGAQLWCRVVISPSYTKASGEDTLFSYTLTATG